VIIFYNEECSKCREALDLLEKNDCVVEVRNYLQNPPSVDELKEILQKLGCRVKSIIRKSEPLFLEKFADKDFTEGEWLRILSENPILIERPILISEEKAVIGRPPRLVLSLVEEKRS
jgi:arsenate reductase (glutaredoxin)